MKKVLLTLFAALAFAFGAIAQDGVKWESGSLQDVLKKADANHAATPAAGPALVFLDCYTTWCGPCKFMSENVFTQKEAGDYFNNKFLNIKIDMEKGEGLDISKYYGIRAYPTFLILDQKGKELGRIEGGGYLEPFIQRVEKVLENLNK
jgi:thiol-disulfide isomerase/thioredoxin